MISLPTRNIETRPDSKYSRVLVSLLLVFLTMLCTIRAQNTQIKIIDKSTNSTPFSLVYLRNLSDYTVNLSQSFKENAVIDPNANYEVICAGYTRITIPGSVILSQQIIYIEPLEYKFGDVQVEKLSTKSLMKIWERTLNKSRRTQNRRNLTNYVHLLSSEQDKQIREIFLCYGSVSNIKNQPRFQISGGDFRSRKNNPFYNFHTSFWILENVSFQHRPIFDNLPSQVPSSALDSFAIYSNSNTTDSLVLIEFTRSDGNLNEAILINKSTRFPISATTIIKKDRSFMYLDGQKVLVDSAHIRVDFLPNSFIPEQIHYHISFSEKTPTHVHGFFMAIEPVQFKQINEKMGSYEPRHMYDQIIMKRQNLISDKIIDREQLDSLFLPGEQNESFLLTQLSLNKRLQQHSYDELLEQTLVINSKHGNLFKNNKVVNHENAIDFTWFARISEDGQLWLFPTLFAESYILAPNEYWWHRLLAMYCIEYIEHQRKQALARSQQIKNQDEKLAFIKRHYATVEFEMRQLLAFPIFYTCDYVIQYVFNESNNMHVDVLHLFFQTEFMKSIDVPFEALPSLKLLWASKRFSAEDKNTLSKYYIELYAKSLKQHVSGKMKLYEPQLLTMFEEMIGVVDLVSENIKLCQLIRNTEMLLNIPTYGACEKK